MPPNIIVTVVRIDDLIREVIQGFCGYHYSIQLTFSAD